MLTAMRERERDADCFVREDSPGRWAMQAIPPECISPHPSLLLSCSLALLLSLSLSHTQSSQSDIFYQSCFSAAHIDYAPNYQSSSASLPALQSTPPNAPGARS